MTDIELQSHIEDRLRAYLSYAIIEDQLYDSFRYPLSGKVSPEISESVFDMTWVQVTGWVDMTVLAIELQLTNELES